MILKKEKELNQETEVAATTEWSMQPSFLSAFFFAIWIALN